MRNSLRHKFGVTPWHERLRQTVLIPSPLQSAQVRLIKDWLSSTQRLWEAWVEQALLLKAKNNYLEQKPYSLHLSEPLLIYKHKVILNWLASCSRSFPSRFSTNVLIPLCAPCTMESRQNLSFFYLPKPSKFGRGKITNKGQRTLKKTYCFISVTWNRLQRLLITILNQRNVNHIIEIHKLLTTFWKARDGKAEGGTESGKE